MEAIIGGAKKSVLKWFGVVLAAALFGAGLYFVIVVRFTPSWVLGEELASAHKYVEISPIDLEMHPNLGKFIKNMSRNSEDPKQGVRVLIRGSNGEGKRLKKFLESQFSTGNSSYPYMIKYQSKYYGLDIIFQFKSPWVLN